MKTKLHCLFNKTLTFFAMTAFLCCAMALSNVVYAYDPALYIWNNSGEKWNATYLSDSDGSWSSPPNLITPHKLFRSDLIHNKLYHAAILRVIIGNKMGKFYCVATLKIPAFGEQPILIAHNGSCHFTQLKQGRLAMVIDRHR